MKRFSKVLTVAVAASMAFSVAACGGQEEEGEQGVAASPASVQPAKAGEASTAAKTPVKVVWWHAMSGELGKAVDTLVADFNSMRKDVQVEAVYQGTYDESLNKLKASMDSKSGPAMIQVYEIGSRFMIDSKAVAPIQTFIDAEKFDTSSWEPNILSYYTLDGKLNSMPFNTSNPILYYNKDMFKAAGLDPEKAPSTYEEVAAAAEKLTKDGKSGASFAIYGWFMEQFFANQGAEYVNNGNGRTAPATESLAAADAGVNTLAWWKELIDKKTATNLGRKTEDTRKAFAAGQVAMILDSTASLRGIVNSADGKFAVGTGFLPKPQNAKEGGVIVGGASNYILNNRPEAEQKAAWEFIKYLASPEVQAAWHISTGYFPVTTKAYDLPNVKDNMAKYPQFQTAVNQLHSTKAGTATQGAVMGVFPEARQIMESAIEEALNAKKSPKEAMEGAAKEITAKLEVYNKTVK
ncbi:MAG: transporter substrate-binding protein [Paenibacillaceae bacterium]|jgi:sn-glycerol 3-phosphate transport system substrate-binding protein|nr:transporter substrate-binding protein [Paenibacillaceae bacterium]